MTPMLDRFASYLHKLTKNTQFIIITHRRGTMECRRPVCMASPCRRRVFPPWFLLIWSESQLTQITRMRMRYGRRKERDFLNVWSVGLTKTRDNIVAGFDSIFSGYSSIDDDFYEELEEILIMGDIGINATISDHRES